MSLVAELHCKQVPHVTPGLPVIMYSIELVRFLTAGGEQQGGQEEALGEEQQLQPPPW